jgi:N-acetylglucosaminyldiphosphoundecaprenol N-acetyl-beta-D-mannosaminyltransferase
MKNLLNIELQNDNLNQVLEKTKEYLSNPSGFFHITSINPETIMLARQNELFKTILNEGQIKINDGVGISLAAKILGIKTGPRITGVDLMIDLLNIANRGRLSVMLLGAGPKIADNVVICQKRAYPEVRFISMTGIENIKNPKISEENTILAIVRNRKPHMLFVAFGSPYQEMWIWKHKKQLEGIICMGVGGAFDFLSGNITRPPKILRHFGLEWLHRLVISPKRLYKQSYWIKFMSLVIKQRFNKNIKITD